MAFYCERTSTTRPRHLNMFPRQRIFHLVGRDIAIIGRPRAPCPEGEEDEEGQHERFQAQAGRRTAPSGDGGHRDTQARRPNCCE
jgi:hypothetical protein